MARFFHSKGLGPEVLDYFHEKKDWLLTRPIPGESCLAEWYLQQPKRLCDVTAELLRQLHDTPATGCPVNRIGDYIDQVQENHRLGKWDATLFPDNWGYRSPSEAWQQVEAAIPYLQADTLLHGDYCLPNIILQDWQFSGFIDLGSGGLGDRHIDLFWGLWSLEFNLKTNRYRQRFLDVYGRDRINLDLLDTIGAFEVFL